MLTTLQNVFEGCVCDADILIWHDPVAEISSLDSQPDLLLPTTTHRFASGAVALRGADL